MTQAGPSASRPWLARYADGVPHELVQDHATMLDLVDATVAATPDAPAIRYFDGTVGFAELDARADALAAVALDPARRAALSRVAVEHARGFSWDRTTDALLATYAEAAAEFAQRQEAALPAEGVLGAPVGITVGGPAPRPGQLTSTGRRS